MSFQRFRILSHKVCHSKGSEFRQQGNLQLIDNEEAAKVELQRRVLEVQIKLELKKTLGKKRH